MLISGVLIGLTSMNWIDPATSLVIVAVIAVGTWGLLKESLKLSLLGVPPGIEHKAVDAWLRGEPGVTGVHDPPHLAALDHRDCAHCPSRHAPPAIPATTISCAWATS